METTSILFFSLLISNINLQKQSGSVSDAEKLAPFYHEEVVIPHSTYDWMGANKQSLNHDSHDLRIIRITRTTKMLVTGRLFAKIDRHRLIAIIMSSLKKIKGFDHEK